MMDPRRRKKIIVGLVLFFLWLPILLVAQHSVEEIHYLKSFFPGRMGLSEAFLAALIELIKVFLIVLPLGIAMIFVWKLSRD